LLRFYLLDEGRLFRIVGRHCVEQRPCRPAQLVDVWWAVRRRLNRLRNRLRYGRRVGVLFLRHRRPGCERRARPTASS
jgi:hypothetical protein